jgi:EF hand
LRRRHAWATFDWHDVCSAARLRPGTAAKGATHDDTQLSRGIGDRARPRRRPRFRTGRERSDTDTQFTRLDADHDGFVTRADMSTVPELARRFAKFDADKDGKLNRAEFAALIAAMK